MATPELIYKHPKFKAFSEEKQEEIRAELEVAARAKGIAEEEIFTARTETSYRIYILMTSKSRATVRKPRKARDPALGSAHCIKGVNASHCYHSSTCNGGSNCPN